jgi:hypothetical protein
VIAVIALMALYFGGGIPLEQPSGTAPDPSREDPGALVPTASDVN